MEDTTTPPELDPSTFALAAYDSVTVVMPPLPVATDDDIDAQLFEFVASAKKGSGITSIADLDDGWVQANFEGMSTIAELRRALKLDLEKQGRNNWSNLKFSKCADALMARLEGEVSAAVVEANVEASRAQYDERLLSFGMTKRQYLREEHLTEEQFEQKLHDDVAYQLRFNMALDKMIEISGTAVAKSELTEYLSCEDPAAFAAELEATGRVEDARRAAARVKVMRRVVETAVVKDESEGQAD
ncbi:hypothetical protein [Gordonibacter sp.]|uniref:hypothetical protein n=1 Tax=Gordonibacter sp. TaxID=1968902 RepID=UPI002FCC5484